MVTSQYFFYFVIKNIQILPVLQNKNLQRYRRAMDHYILAWDVPFLPVPFSLTTLPTKNDRHRDPMAFFTSSSAKKIFTGIARSVQPRYVSYEWMTMDDHIIQDFPMIWDLCMTLYTGQKTTFL